MSNVTTELTKFGLLSIRSGKLCGFSTSSNDGNEFCNSVNYILEENRGYWDYGVWLVNSYEQAEYVRNNATEWYNSGYDTPSHNFEANDLRVVEVKLVVNL